MVNGVNWSMGLQGLDVDKSDANRYGRLLVRDRVDVDPDPGKQARVGDRGVLGDCYSGLDGLMGNLCRSILS